MKLLQPWLLGLAGTAAAAVLPAGAASAASSSSVQCFADGNSEGPIPEACDVGGIPGVPSSAHATAELSPVPFADIEVASPPNGVFGAGASAQAFYSFQVLGGTPGDVVPILIDARLHASSTPQSSASAKLVVNTVVLGQTPLVEEVCTAGTCGGTSFVGTLSADTKSGSVADSILLAVQGQATATGSLDETAHAFAGDPYISVDPAFPDADLYSIVVSEGVGNVPVPEPAQATLSFVGFAVGALGLASRRRR